MSGALAKIVLSRGYSNNKRTDKVYISLSTYSYLSRGNTMYNDIPTTAVQIPEKTLKMFSVYEDKYNLPMKDILYMLHWDRKMPIKNGMDIELGRERGTVTKWMKLLDVRIRSLSEDMHRRYSMGARAWCEGLTKDTHPGLMINSMKHRGENNPMHNMRGSLHPMWTGGEKYWKHKDWMEIREEARKRDEYKCTDCGLSDIESNQKYGQPLQVHHVIPYKKCKKHELSNLVTLCASCHCKADGNLVGGEKWKQKKSSKLKESNRKQSTISQY